MERFKNWLNDTHFDFVQFRKPAGLASLVMVVGAWVAFVVVGPNWGIDFTGGTEIHLGFEEPTTIEEVRGALRSLGLADDSVQQVGGSTSTEFAIRIQDAEFGAKEMRDAVEAALVGKYGTEWIKEATFSAEVGARFAVTYNGPKVQLSELMAVLDVVDGSVVSEGSEDNEVIVKLPGLASQIQKNISAALNDKAFEVLSIDSVGPKVGADLQRQGFIAIGATLGLVLLYIAFRFDLTFAPGAIVALFHDVSIVVGIFTVAQLEFNLPMIGALLTIVGYSLNDTIIIYDRIRENRDRYQRKDTIELINTSINETLARTIATSTTTLIAILLFLVLGGPVIQNFALAMCLGIVFGTYSTVYIASPMILVMEDVKPFLARLIVTSSADADDASPEEEEDAFIASLSQSEQRRRERERAARQEQTVE